MTWRKLIRIAIKAAIFFLICNLVWIPVSALDVLGRISIYNALVPGRARLPYGENPAESFNLSLTSIPAMFASHEISRPKAADEFRVVVIGDSSTWGWLLDHDETVAAQLEDLAYTSADGRRVEVYNLGYPGMSLTKDSVILHQALNNHQTDVVIWLMTAQSFPDAQQTALPLVQTTPRSDWDRTIVGQRREIADWLRLQFYGFAWSATGIDQAFPDEITPRQSDFEADVSWQSHDQPEPLNDLAFGVLDTGSEWAREYELPLLFVNEPIYISSGRNSDIRYNSFYPRWAYDQYRELLSEQMEGRAYLDLWDAIPPDEFTDTPVHLTPNGTRMLAERIGTELESMGWVRR